MLHQLMWWKLPSFSFPHSEQGGVKTKVMIKILRDPITSTAEGQVSFLFKIQYRSVND